MSLLGPSPTVVLIDDLIGSVNNHGTGRSSFAVLVIEIHTVEVVELALVEVGQVPVDADVLKAQIVPIVGVGVVWDSVVMHVLASHEAASDLDEFATVKFFRSAGSLTISSGHPSAFHDQGSTCDRDRVSLRHQCFLHGDLTTFVTVNGVDNVEAWDLFSIDQLVLGDENFLGVVELAKDEVRAETVLDLPFFLGHAPPGEVHLLPGSAVSYRLSELVVGFSASPLLFDHLTVVEVRESSC